MAIPEDNLRRDLSPHGGPDVTVCITTCNQRDYVAQCLLSVLDQGGRRLLEVIVGDDCSDDGTSEIVALIAKQHPHLVTHIRHGSRLGPSKNTQFLMRLAKGRYVARLDGDDYWFPGKIDAQAAYLDQHADCVAVYTNAVTVTEAGQRIGLFNDVGDATFDLAAMVRRGNFLNNSSVMIRSELVGSWLEIADDLIDYRAHLLHARRGVLAQISKPFVAYRVNTIGSMVLSRNETVRRLYWEAILSVPREAVGDWDYAWGLANFLSRVAVRAIRTRDMGLVREWWPRVVSESPRGSLVVGVMAMWDLFRALGFWGKHRLCKLLGGHCVPVLHHR
ncbi:glycosyltransferase [Luteimonas sp. 8-5]|uniref:glycosyltransferase n=1 Tax=Luteimonas sp. 8-5 TaxID=3039387 RepID=UPI00243657F4|nr:glycosyltransferase [Luteimonas sp. 8-5]MDG6347843.1 glycosyltransferase [Luteimonas sp. 8-5]